MATFVIETYVSRARSELLDVAAARLRASVRAPARYLRSFYVADDEVAYHLVEVSSAEAAAALSRAAGLVADRIVEAEPASG